MWLVESALNIVVSAGSHSANILHCYDSLIPVSISNKIIDVCEGVLTTYYLEGETS